MAEIVPLPDRSLAGIQVPPTEHVVSTPQHIASMIALSVAAVMEEAAKAQGVNPQPLRNAVIALLIGGMLAAGVAVWIYKDWQREQIDEREAISATLEQVAKQVTITASGLAHLQGSLNALYKIVLGEKASPVALTVSPDAVTNSTH